MKSKFQQLSIQKQILIHFLMFVLLLIVIPCLVTYIKPGLFFTLWILCFIFEIVLLVWTIKSKKEKRNERINDKKNEQIKTEIEENIQEKESSTIKNDSLDNSSIKESTIQLPEINNSNGRDYKLKYIYNENLCFCENIESVEILSRVGFKQEIDNQYDPETVSVVFNDKKIGLLYKGDCRDILNKCFRNKNDTVVAFVNKIDLNKNQIRIIIGFYEEVNQNNVVISSLLKTHVVDTSTEEPRQEKVEFLEENDNVYFEENLESNNILVKSECGDELGELSELVSQKILNKKEDLEKVYGKVFETDYKDDKKIVKIKIYL